MNDAEIPKLEQDPVRSPAQMEVWAIQSQFGKTEQERQLAASCLLAAAKHWARMAAQLAAPPTARVLRLVRSVDDVQAPGHTPNNFPDRGPKEGA